MDHDERALFEQTVRAMAEADSGAAFDDALMTLGWRDALAEDPQAAVAVLFEAQGWAGARSSALDWLMIDHFGVADGSPVVQPRLGRALPPGRIEGGRLSVDGVMAAPSSVVDRVTAAALDGDSVVVVSVASGDLEVTAVSGIDPASALHTVTGNASFDIVGPVDWPAAVRSGRLALSHELVGASRRMLELARVHALERHQFGVPIASFQAVRHRLAETLVAIEMAASALDAAWLDPADHHAVIAKAVAGRSARATSRHAQQVLAGIGYTLEHPFHEYARRVFVLDELFTSSKTLTRELGSQLLASGALPPLIAL